ncbi:DUF968 domain-containing protein [Sneathiella glossodoripedis]|uniref:DUF968 domain-containing protein n=1 Tax=Sneathiella glossodoripedis TaxID=418853 RepID=UPI0004713F4F|nr:hypothetical protein [Sneathiella glossodoripedis]
MLFKAKKKKPKIDKSQLAIGLPKKFGIIDKTKLFVDCVVRFRDPAYLKSFKGAACFACGIIDGTIIAAHIRPGWYARSKPHDFWTIPLCSRCHAIEGKNPTKFYAALGYTIKQIKRIAYSRYRSWLSG